MNDLKGKRLLIAGSSGLLVDTVETAKRLGVYTIVTDYYPHGIAKRFADKSYDISTADMEAMEKLVRDEKIDGVFTGYSEVSLYFAQELCNRLGIPFYATKEQLDTVTNKLKFKEMCRRHGVPTVKQFELDSRCLPEHLSKIEYPVIVKPADSIGAKGVSVCSNEEELRQAVELALSFSGGKELIVERYFDPFQYGDFGVYYTIQDGDIRLSAMCDRVVYIGEQGAPLPLQLRMPSKHLNAYMERTDALVREMFRAEGFRNGTLFMQGFAEGENFYFFEMGFRLNGAQEYVCVSHINGNNALEAHIHYALTGKADYLDMDRENPRFSKPCCNLVLLLRPGVIARCDGLDKVRQLPGVLNVSQLLDVGDTVGRQGTLGQTLARLHLVQDTEEALDALIQKVKDMVDVRDAENNDLLIGD